MAGNGLADHFFYSFADGHYDDSGKRGGKQVLITLLSSLHVCVVQYSYLDLRYDLPNCPQE